jgi:16S rRNA (adenine1518-N6/adenine1519-N6)-dimethyltransferase
LREVIAAHGLGARKSLGQHFLLDLNLTRRIAEAAGPIKGATVIEIGPGPGGLTRAILGAGARHVIAIEKDARCRDALASLVDAAGDRLTLIDADAMEVNEPELVGALGVAPRNLHIISNLPYNISTALIIKWLRQVAERPETYAGLVLTVQKEVGDRICAIPRTKAYGRLSVMCQWLAECTSCFDIAARAFTPPPKVTSSVLRFIPRPAPLAPAAWELMEATTRAAFGQRRKMLRPGLWRDFRGRPLGCFPVKLNHLTGKHPKVTAEITGLRAELSRHRPTPSTDPALGVRPPISSGPR